MLCRAVQVVQQHMAAGRLLQGAPTDQCRTLLLLGAGRSPLPEATIPYFMARGEMALQLPHLAAHCKEMWLKRLRAPARLRPIGERFLLSPPPPPSSPDVPDATTEFTTVSPGIRPATGIVGAGGNGGRVPPHPPQPEFFGLVTGDPLGRIRAGLSLHGFHAVM